MIFVVVVRFILYYCIDKYVGDCMFNDYEFFLKMQVYVIMYLNDVQRILFYEGIGFNIWDFDMYVIVEVSFIFFCWFCVFNEF